MQKAEILRTCLLNLHAIHNTQARRMSKNRQGYYNLDAYELGT